MRRLAWMAMLVALAATLSARVHGEEPLPLAFVRHRLALPDARPLAGVGKGVWADVDVIPGQAPGSAHPQGTVLVAQATADDPSPAITEWDLATGSIVRSAVLPLPATQADLRLVRAGGRLHAFASRAPDGRIFYVRLDAALRIEHVAAWGKGERPRVATDGHAMAVLWSGSRAGTPSDRGWQLEIIDALGRPSWTATVARRGGSTFAFGNPLAFVDGRAFVLLAEQAVPNVVAFSPDGHERQVSALPFRPDDGRLFASQGHVFFTDGCRVMDLAGGSFVRAPNRDEGVHHCAAFDAVADAEGRLVTATGDVRSATMALLARFADPVDAAERRPLWCFGRPARLVVERLRGRVWLDWAELEQVPCRSCEGRSTQPKAFRNSVRFHAEVPCVGPFDGHCKRARSSRFWPDPQSRTARRATIRRRSKRRHGSTKDCPA
jgi:hypothetical protein